MRTISAMSLVTIAINANTIRAIQQERLQKEIKGNYSSKINLWLDSKSLKV